MLSYMFAKVKVSVFTVAMATNWNVQICEFTILKMLMQSNYTYVQHNKKSSVIQVIAKWLKVIKLYKSKQFLSHFAVEGN